MRWIEARGAALRYQLTEPSPAGPAGSTIVLIHEAGGSLESWDAVLPLLPAGCRVLRYDQRGFGMSERCTTLTLGGMVADLAALLDALGLTAPCHLVGMAIGASMALAFAAAHPARVAGVVATSPITGGISGAARDFLEQRARLLETEGLRAVAEASLARSYPPKLRHDADAYAQYRGRFLANDARAFAAMTRAFMTVELSGLYEHIRCPALVIGCVDDAIKPPHESAQVAAALPRGRFVQADSGHFIAVQSPALLADLVRAFLEDFDARR